MWADVGGRQGSAVAVLMDVALEGGIEISEGDVVCIGQK
jgi:hypothetical protein